MQVLQASSAIYRPHVGAPSCWCRPEVCEDCGELTVHRILEVRPDRERRMAVFSEPVQIPV